MEHAPLPASIAAISRQLRAALDGGPALAPLPRLHAGDLPAGTAVVVRTSGSTGTPREVAITASALRASATATHERLGGPGRWVLSLPATHIAGVQVVMRSLLAAGSGIPTPLVAAEPGARFTPDGLAALLAPALADDVPVHVSLVPTQLHRVLAAADDGAPAGLDALARCGSVLLGGAATAPPLLARALALGVPVVRTYGMSETAGGCVYDGVPLRGVRLRLAGSPAGGTGVVEITGPTLAACYVGDADATTAAFRTDDDGTRWFRTSDLGALDAGVLTVLGRADDVVVTGGVNVAPAAVESVLAEVLPGVLGVAGAEVCVVGVPDAEWGQALVAVVATHTGDAATHDGDRATGTFAPLPAEVVTRVRAAVATRLGAPSAPRRVYVTGALPLRGPGKVDRRAVAEAVAAH